MSLSDRFRLFAQKHGERLAIATGNGGTATYRELDVLVGKRGGQLRALGGSRPIAILMRNDVESVVNLLGADSLDRSVVLMPPSLDRSQQLRVARLARSSLLLDGMHIVQTGLDEAGAETQPDNAICQLTSGSSGPARLAVRSKEGIQAEIAAVQEKLHISSADRVLSVSSLAHSYALVGGLLTSLTNGAHVMLGTSGETMGLMEQRPTILFGLPSTYERLSSGPKSITLRFALSAGAPLSHGVFDVFYSRWGLPIRQDYGTTETGTIAIDSNPITDPRTVGQPLEHLEVRIAGSKEAQAAGEIQVRGKAVAKLYLTQAGPQATADKEGWYETGDEGRLESGSLFVGRRIRPPIRIGAMEFRPEYLESVLQEMPGIREAVVLADVPGTWKAIVAAQGIRDQDVFDWCREHLGSPPSTVDVRDAIPRSPAGKILHKDLV